MALFADDYVAAHEPWLTADLETYLRAIASMFGEVELYAFDTEDGDEGWTILFDPDRAPAKALPYLAQLVGERLPIGIGEAAAREWIKDRPNSRRGTPASIFYAAQRRLINARLVAMVERDGDVDDLTVITYTEDTPDPDGTLADLLSVVPADVILSYQTLDGQVWSTVKGDEDATWADVKADNATWDVVRTTRVGDNTFSRWEPS